MINRSVRRLLRAVPIAAVLMLLLTALYLVSNVEQEATQLGRLAQWVVVLTALSLLILAGVIIGRLVKLVARLRAGEPGARLTARLVGVFVALTLPPVIILYLFAVQFLSDTIEGWLDVEAEQALSDSIELGQMFMDMRTRQVRAEVSRLGDQLVLDDDDAMFRRLLRQVSSSGPTELAVLSASGHVRASVNIEAGVVLPDLPDDFALIQAVQGGEYAAAEPEQDGIMIRVLRNLGAPEFGGEELVLQAIYPMPDEFSHLAAGIEQSYHRYQNISFIRTRLQQSLVLILSLVLLLTALLAMLLAFNAARRLTRPIRELAEATEELAAGRFPHDLEVTTRDELGFLVSSFNTMTRELAVSRQQLEAQRRYLEIVLGRLSAGVLAIDDDGRISAFNESAARILELDESAHRGVTLAELGRRREDLQPLVGTIERQFAGPGADWREEIKLASGERPLVLMCRGSDLPAETGGHVVVFDDVTVLDEAQREAAWAEVARRLAHEVKNPLTPIQLAAERLQYKLSPALTGNNAELLGRATQTIRGQVDALRRLVNAFGDYARPSAMKSEPVSLPALIDEVVELYGSGDAPIAFDIDCRSDAGKIVADPGRLRQVLLNLVRNAQEAHPDARPRIAITLAVESRDERAGVCLTLSDDGPGFDEQVLERIFEPYVTTKERGSGLGLAIVRRIVEEHGGVIEVGNRAAGGARISLWLPASPQA